MDKQLLTYVIDDNPDFADSLALMVRHLGHQPRVFYSGEAVLKALGEDRPDVILSDLVMPGIDGATLAQKVKSAPNCEKTVLVAVTGHEDERHTDLVVAAGFDYRFIKPVELSDLQHLFDHLRGQLDGSGI